MKRATITLAFFCLSLILACGYGHGDHHSHHGHQQQQQQQQHRDLLFANLDLSLHDKEEDGMHNCGTPDLTRTQAIVEQVRIQANLQRRNRRRQLSLKTCTELQNEPDSIEIKTNLHLTTVPASNQFGGDVELVPHPTQSVARVLDGDRTLSLDDFSTVADIEAIFDNNLAVVNNAYADSPFVFTRGITTMTLNPEWAFEIGNAMQEISAAVGSDDLRQLDVFLGVQVDLNATIGRGVLPSSQLAGKGDGVAVRYDVLTGGGFPGYDEGYALVHEIGHWLGLLHTFQSFLRSPDDDPCWPEEENYNDFVDDTPMHDGPSGRSLDPSESCVDYLPSTATLPDTCPNLPGLDPFYNYMNYLDDDICFARRGEFTCGQIERMYLHWELFRNAVSACADPANEMEIEIVFVIDSRYVDDFTQIVLYNSDSEEVIFDSITDHLIGYILYEDDISSMEVDVCVPRNQEYVIGVVDNLGTDGFIDGSLAVYLDGVLWATLDHTFGSFGEGLTLTIPASETTPNIPTAEPTPKPTEDFTNILPGLVTELNMSKPLFTTPTPSPSETPTASLGDADGTVDSPENQLESSGVMGHTWSTGGFVLGIAFTVLL